MTDPKDRRIRPLYRGKGTLQRAMGPLYLRQRLRPGACPAPAAPDGTIEKNEALWQRIFVRLFGTDGQGENG